MLTLADVMGCLSLNVPESHGGIPRAAGQVKAVWAEADGNDGLRMAWH